MSNLTYFFLYVNIFNLSGGYYMNNKNIDDILFKYILNSTSYIRTLLTFLPEEEVSTGEKAIILEIFNLILKI